MLIVLLITFIAAVCLYQLFAYKRMYRYVLFQLSKPRPEYFPKASVILPCKGLDPDFKGNLQKLITQTYKSENNLPNTEQNFEIIFTVATIDDPAYSVLREVIEENPHIKSKLVVAGIDNRRTQKITNQLAALKEISADTEVLIFVDSDVVARTDFLAQLVSPLQDATIGIATGYRFYLPSKFSIPALIRALWNRMSAWELSSKKFSYAWGGAIAIKRTIFERAKVAEFWDRAAVDDMSMTTAVKNLGLSVYFVPQCLVISHGDASWSEVLEWTNRQLILTKVYYPQLWHMAVIRAGVMAIWLLLVITLSLQIIISRSFELAPVLISALSLLVVETYFLFQAHGLWYLLLNKNAIRTEADQYQFEKDYQNLLWQSVLILPLAHIILPLLTLYSLLTNRIRWRGINYELKSPQEIVVS